MRLRGLWNRVRSALGRWNTSPASMPFKIKVKIIMIVRRK
jgi:hypothetical protein